LVLEEVQMQGVIIQVHFLLPLLAAVQVLEQVMKALLTAALAGVNGFVTEAMKIMDPVLEFQDKALMVDLVQMSQTAAAAAVPVKQVKATMVVMVCHRQLRVLL
jgi:hypothetical protein